MNGARRFAIILHPYKLIKDNRSGYETGNIQPVLDGELDEFIKAYLLHATKKFK